MKFELMNQFLPTILQENVDVSSEITKGLFDSFYPNIWIFVAHIVAAIIIIAIIVFLIWRPTRQLIAARRNLMDKAIQDSKEAYQNAKIHLKTAEEEKINAKKIAHTLIYDAQKEAERVTDQAEERVNIITKSLFEKANIESEKIKIDAKQKIQKDVNDLAFIIAEKILNKEVNKEENAKLIDEYIKNLE